MAHNKYTVGAAIPLGYFYYALFGGFVFLCACLRAYGVVGAAGTVTQGI